MPVGFTAVDFPTRRRLRVNGTIIQARGENFTVRVREVYGNCPKYIRRREFVPRATVSEPLECGAAVGNRGTALLARCDLAILGSAHPTSGTDASHRGGPPGFIRVVDPGTLEWPDYPGNAMFNTLGNVYANGELALLALDTEGMQLQVAGQGEIQWAAARASERNGKHTDRIVQLMVHRAVLTQSPLIEPPPTSA